MTTAYAFTVDDRDDRERASDGRSRYGAYLRQHAAAFADSDGPTDDPAWFALTAWEIANSPIMAPGYITCHPRVINTVGEWDDEHRAALAVTLATPLPPDIAAAIPWPRWRGWERHGHGDNVPWRAPFDNDHPAAYAALTLRVPLPADVLPAPCYQAGSPDVDTAKYAVTIICELVNAQAAPILTVLDCEGAHR
jgi:hypothetical protein